MKNNFNKIVAGGCSFSAGFNIDDPQNKAWPALLSKKFKMPTINLSLQGVSNDYIFNSIIDYFACNPEEKTNSLVILGITSYIRQEFFHAFRRRTLTLIPDQYFKDESASEFIKLFFENHYDDLYYYKKFLRNLIMIQNYFSRQNIQYIMFDAVSNNFDSIIKLDDTALKLKTQINDIFYLWMGKKSMSDFIAYAPEGMLKDGHPSDLGHITMTNVLYDSIIPMINKN